MRNYFVALPLFLFFVHPAFAATTYYYSGQSIESTSCALFGGCSPSMMLSLAGAVTFKEDTSHYTGVIPLGGDVQSATIFEPGDYFAYSFPSVVYPPNEYAIVSTLGGSFTLSDGKIIDWSLSGQFFTQGCGGGPGCAYNGSFQSTAQYDSVYYYSYPYIISGTNTGGGVWTMEQIASVPEPATWAMLLIGFVGIGFAASRDRKTAFTSLAR